VYRSTCPERRILLDFSEEAPREEACLDFEDASVADSITEDRMRDELVHPTLVPEEKPATSRGSHHHARGVELEILDPESSAVQRADDD
jgi:hypothetical protein